MQITTTSGEKVLQVHRLCDTGLVTVTVLNNQNMFENKDLPYKDIVFNQPIIETTAPDSPMFLRKQAV